MFPKCSRGMFQNVLCKCSHEKFYERSIQMLSERSYGRFQERSLWIFSEYCCGMFSQYSFWTFLERSTGTFREHCFGTFKKPGHFLSSRNVPWTFRWNLPNVPMEPSEHSDGIFRTFHGNVHRTFREGIVLWGKIRQVYPPKNFKGKKSSFFLNIILEKKLAAALGEKLKNMFKIKKWS